MCAPIFSEAGTVMSSPFHLSVCCCAALIACICSSCVCLRRDRLRLPTATQHHIECKHYEIRAACAISWIVGTPPNTSLDLTKHVLEVAQADAWVGRIFWLFIFSPFFQFSLSLFLCLVFAGITAGQFTLSGYACKECPLFVPASGLQPSSPFKT